MILFHLNAFDLMFEMCLTQSQMPFNLCFDDIYVRMCVLLLWDMEQLVTYTYFIYE